MIIRACEEKDIPFITAIYAEAVRFGLATFELKPPSIMDMLQRREKLLANNYPYFVADYDGAIVGYAYAGKYHERGAFSSTVEDSIYIHPSYRGQKIGKQLLEALLKESTFRGFRQMVAVIGDSGNLGSLKLHASVGFEVVGTLKSVGWKLNQWVDTVIMQRSLGDGDASPLAGLVNKNVSK